MAGKGTGDNTDKSTNLIVVTNREPYVHSYDMHGPELKTICKIPAGGVTAALDPVMQRNGGTWVAWGSGDADKKLSDENDRVRVPPSEPSYTLRRVWLTKTEVDNFYYGYCNQGLWPLAHGLLSNVHFEKKQWEYYKRVNRKYADAVLQEIQ